MSDVPSPYATDMVLTIWQPAWWCEENSPIVAAIFQWEWRVIDWLTGEPDYDYVNSAFFRLN